MTVDYGKIAEALETSKANYYRYVSEEQAEGAQAAREWLDLFVSVMAEEADSKAALRQCADLQDALVSIVARNEGGPALLEDKSKYFVKAFRAEVQRVVEEVTALERAMAA